VEKANLKSITSSLVCIYVSLLSMGCSINMVKEVNSPSIPDHQSAECAFDGLMGSESLRHNVVLLVHGMGTQEKNWSKDLRENIAKQSDLSYVEKSKVNDLVIKYHYQQNRDGRTLDMYQLTWSKLTKSAKKAALEYDAAYDEYRTKYNKALKTGLGDQASRWLKEGFMNDRIADVAYYLGDGHEKVVAEVSNALESVNRDILSRYGAGGDVKVAIVSISLGSSIVEQQGTDHGFRVKIWPSIATAGRRYYAPTAAHHSSRCPAAPDPNGSTEQQGTDHGS